MAGVFDNPTVNRGRPDEPPAPEAIAPHFPQLEILGLIGSGGMGVVYRARQRGLDRVIALKVLPRRGDGDPAFAERFAREARAMARLQHPNIVAVHDSGESDGLYWFLMEYVDGMNLRALMDGRRLDPQRALAIVPQLCDALQYAHEEGVLHRDIKPENILLDSRGRAKIADFGLAKLVGAARSDLNLTAPQQIMGTMNYMAPEQIERSSEVDHRADIYALGVVLYEMLTGELPIGRFPLPSERAAVDGRLDEIVLHALEKTPEKRFQSASEVRTAVEALAIPARAPAASAGSASALRAVGAAGYASGAMGYATGATGGIAPGPWWVPKSVGVTYLLWLLCFFGFCGIHRFYLGRWVTGLIWLLTFGILGLGQLLDLLLIPGLVRLVNLERVLHSHTMAASPGMTTERRGR